MRRIIPVPYFLIEYYHDLYDELMKRYEKTVREQTEEILKEYPNVKGVRKIEKISYEDFKRTKEGKIVQEEATCLVVHCEGPDKPFIYPLFVSKNFQIENLKQLGYIVNEKGKVVNGKTEGLMLPFTPEQAEKIIIGIPPENELHIYFS